MDLPGGGDKISQGRAGVKGHGEPGECRAGQSSGRAADRRPPGGVSIGTLLGSGPPGWGQGMCPQIVTFVLEKHRPGNSAGQVGRGHQ